MTLQNSSFALLVLAIAALVACEPEKRTTGNLERSLPGPGTPTIDSVAAGDKSITVYFHGADFNYAAVCNVAAGNTYGSTAQGGQSPLVVKNLTNGVEYSCAVWAFANGKPSQASAYLKTTPKAP